jgi:hypothetical protein
VAPPVVPEAEEKIPERPASPEPEPHAITVAEEPPMSDPPNEKRRRELPKQSALGALLKDVHQQSASVKEEHKTELTQESLEKLWPEFLADNKGKLQNAFLNVAEKQIPQLNNDVIIFTEANNISLELLQLHKMEILSFIRKHTTSKTASLEFKLQRNEAKDKPYKTSKDRIRDMIQDNPAVLKLIQKLDLNEY